MKAITIWQPWASLIMEGLKPFEFRRWPAPRNVRGQRIAIHAGARPVRRSELADLILRCNEEEGWSTGLKWKEALPLLEKWHLNPERMFLSAILGTALLGTPRRVGELLSGKMGDSDRIDHNKWAWPLTDIERFEAPIPTPGAQGFWDWRP